MNSTLRRIAVSGSAAVALLGGAAAITTVTADTASAAEIQTAVNQATGTPVTMPDGRTVHVRGLDNAAYRADAGHRTTVVQLAAATDTQPGGTAGIDNSLNGPAPQGGVGQQIQQPGYNPQQIRTQAGAGGISLTVAIGVGLLIVVIVMVKNGKVRFVQAAACVALGVYLAPTFVGPLVQQLGGSVGVGLGNVWAGF